MKWPRRKSRRSPGIEEILAVRILRSTDPDPSVQVELRRAETEVGKQFIEIHRGAEEAESITPETLEQIVRCV